MDDEWKSGTYISNRDAWYFVVNNVEFIVPGGIDAPQSHWLAVAKEVAAALPRYTSAAVKYLEVFLSRPGGDWELDSVECGMPGVADRARFVLYFHATEDGYGLWSVAFNSTGLPAPNDDATPFYFSRKQQ